MYSVEAAADRVGVHQRTILRFIQQGKLKAHKVGRQWRITAADLNSLLGESVQTKKAESSSVLDIPVSNDAEANRLNNLVMAALNSRSEDQYSPRVDFLYNKDEGRVRFILWGSIKFMKDFYSMMDNIL